MRNVLDHTMHSAAEEFLVFVVHCHDNKEFRAARGVVVDLTEGKARVFEVVGVAGGSGITMNFIPVAKFTRSSARQTWCSR